MCFKTTLKNISIISESDVFALISALFSMRLWNS